MLPVTMPPQHNTSMSESYLPGLTFMTGVLSYTNKSSENIPLRQESLSQDRILIEFAKVKVMSNPRRWRMPMITKCCYKITNLLCHY